MREKLKRAKILGKIGETTETFKVVFKKQNGTMRTMRCRQGVEHNIKGGTNTVMKDDNAYLTTFDVDAFDYRTINLDTVTKLTVNGIKYKIT